jgi:hypothetical protein
MGQGGKALIISFRRLKKVVLFLSLFALLVFFIIQLLMILFPNTSPYHEPYGSAIKVSNIEEQPTFFSNEWIDRLTMFYLLGE